MAVTDETRYELHKHFEETMGRERATTLMELLPPVGWGDIATKQDVLLVKEDIGRLREWVSERMATKGDLQATTHKLELEVHKAHNSLLRELRIWATTLLMAMIALTGIAVGLG